MIKNLLLIVIGLTATSTALFGADITIAFTPSTVTYPPSVDSFTCQANGGGNLPCIAFSGLITDIDTDGSLLLLSDISITLDGSGSTYLTGDNTFYNDAGGLLVGDPNAATDNNPFSNTYTGPIFGLDIAPNTPSGIYTGTIQILGNNLTNDTPGTNEYELGQQTFTVDVVPEPFTLSLTAAGLLALAASRRLRRSRAR